MAPVRLSRPIQVIRGVRLPNHPPNTVWDISLDSGAEGVITAITSHHSTDGHDPSTYPLILPASVHPHIHLDKAYIHSAPEYAHLLPSKGSFHEALVKTTQAKQMFTRADLLRRGEWLLAESVASGVTAMRAFVEVDHTVKHLCLEAGIELKKKWKESCAVQLVCFAQDPIFSSEYGEENRELMEEAISSDQIDVIGTTPYVESCVEASKKNIEWAIDQALRLRKHLDFHLDYNLDSSQEAMVWYVLETLRAKGWTAASTSKRVMLGHCTRLTLFDDEEWSRLAREIRNYNLPVSFVALPTSDLYMAAPPRSPQNDSGSRSAPHERPRGTLQPLKMIRDHGIDAALGVNNVGNAFTPWGNADPLSLACLGVGIYQAGTQSDAELLYECVSTRARAAIGLQNSASNQGSGLAVKEGDHPEFLIIHNIDESGCNAPRIRRCTAEVIWDPPARLGRDVVTGGRLVGKPMLEMRAKSSPGTHFSLAEE